MVVDSRDPSSLVPMSMMSVWSSRRFMTASSGRLHPYSINILQHTEENTEYCQ